MNPSKFIKPYVSYKIAHVNLTLILNLLIAMTLSACQNEDMGEEPSEYSNLSEPSSTDHGQESETQAGTSMSSPFPESHQQNGNDEEDIEEEIEDPVAEVQCIDNGPTQLFLSADDSNSQASPVLARSLIQQKRFVPAQSMRTYEFLNYADFDYAPPSDGLAIYPEMRLAEGTDAGEGNYQLQIGLRASQIEIADLAPMHLILVLDSSGSMSGTALRTLKSTVQTLSRNLRSSDRVSVVKLDAEPRLILNHQSVNEEEINRILDDLVPNGITAFGQATELAYEQALTHQRDDHKTHVILISDGGANANDDELEQISAMAGTSQQAGIFLMGVGVGEGFNDGLMDAVTDAGKGSYVFIDSADEAQHIFNTQFVNLFSIAALDVQVSLTLPSLWSVEVFYGEQISTVASEVDTQNLSYNDQMIFNQVVSHCDPQAIDGSDEWLLMASYTDPISGERMETELSFTFEELMENSTPNLKKGSALIAFAEGLKSLFPLRAKPYQAPSSIIQEESTDEDPRSRSEICTEVEERLNQAQSSLDEEDAELSFYQDLLGTYCQTITTGQAPDRSCDYKQDASPRQAIGLCDNDRFEEDQILGILGTSVAVLANLRDGSDAYARQGCQLLAISSGDIYQENKQEGELSSQQTNTILPRYSVAERVSINRSNTFDMTQYKVTLTAPEDAQSFSFDFRFFSAEFPQYIGSEYNDAFYAIQEAESTNNRAPTNISFDAVGKAIEINNNYFASPFHPCSERGTGYVNGGPTCWLRTSWPIQGGETFTLTFSVYDTGDQIYTSTVLLDHFKFHKDPAVGMTDPLN
ncbi:MAG: hypothetical protein CMH49_06710 [Myxococcales bacterium]|nr:hypothetical protein [Myxococcales bacterium]